MSYNNVEVKITVKVDGKRVGRRKVTRASVSTLEEGRQLLADSRVAVSDLAADLRKQVGV